MFFNSTRMTVCAYVYTTAARSLQNINAHAQTNILAPELCLDLRLSRRPACLETLVGKLFGICTAFERFDSSVKLAPFPPLAFTSAPVVAEEEKL